jgi:stage II sporulation protein D
VITRRTFLAAAAAAAAMPRRAAAQEEFDPAVTSSAPELRVLLGAGTAVTLAGGGFSFNGRTYRGTFDVAPDGSVVNTLKLEEYLYSVVPREMTSSWPAAALQTQAICARTYVLQRSNPRRTYDLVPSEIDQVYGGVESETPAARDAVAATDGMVLRYGPQFAQVMYSSCCGGRTESASDAWGGPPIAYLDGVVCTTCTQSPYYRWTRAITFDQVARAFATELLSLGPLHGLAIDGTDASGRARAFSLVAQQGSTQVKATAFRLRVGVRTMPSLLVTRVGQPDAASPTVAIEGGGLGHGVGLCQWGARGLALQGASYRDILRSYFPGTDIDHE